MTRAELSGSVMVGIDGSDAAARALAWALHHVRLQERQLVIVHVVPTEEPGAAGPGAGHHGTTLEEMTRTARLLLELSVAEVKVRAPALEVAALLEQGDPVDVLAELSHGVALLVVGARGRGSTSARLGHVAAGASGRAHSPVLVHRSVQGDPQLRVS